MIWDRERGTGKVIYIGKRLSEGAMMDPPRPASVGATVGPAIEEQESRSAWQSGKVVRDIVNRITLQVATSLEAIEKAARRDDVVR